MSQLERRTARLRPANPGEPAITYVIQLVPTDAGVGGHLVVREVDGTETPREVPGPDCHHVLEAAALIAALLADPAAGPPKDDLKRLVETTERRPERVAKPGSPGESAAKHDANDASAWRFGAGARAGAQSAIAPNVTPTFSGHASIGYAINDVVEPTLRVAGLYARSGVTSVGGSGNEPLVGEARFTWAAARLSLCPVRWAPHPDLVFRPCAIGDLGSLSGKGTNTVGPATRSLLWGSGGLELEADAALLGPLLVGAEGAIFTPFSRDLFFFGPDDTIHEVPPLGFSVSAGVGLRFF